MKKKEQPKTRLIRVDESVAQKVEGWAKPMKQSIGGFFTIAAEEKLDKLKKDKP